MKEIVVNKTRGMCQFCYKEIPAEVVERDGRMVLKKYCDVHGFLESLHSLDIPHLYREMNRIFGYGQSRNAYRGLMLYVTEACNMACPVCFVDQNERGRAEPSLAEISRFLDGFKGYRITISGGEPTMRKDLFDIVTLAKKKGLLVSLATNGLKLVDLEYCRQLKSCGVDIVVLAFDGFEEKHYLALRNKNVMKERFLAFQNLKNIGMSVYAYYTLIQGVNDDQFSRMFRFARDNSDCIKVLGICPVYQMGRFNDYPRVTKKTVYNKFAQEGVSLEYFIMCTELRFILDQIQQYVRDTAGCESSQCVQRAIFLKVDGELRFLSQVVDMEGLMELLRRLSEKLKSQKKRNSKQTFWSFMGVFFIPFFIKQFATKKMFRSFTCQYFRSYGLSFKDFSKKIISSYVFALQVHSFQGWENADMSIIRSCTLYATDFAKGASQVACLKTMAREYAWKKERLEEV